MNEAIFKIAASVSTPLALAGVIVALFSSIALALIKSNKLTATTAEGTLILLRRLLTFFFVLSLVSAVLGFVGWIYQKSVRRTERIAAVDAFSELVTTMRTETDKLVIEYPDLYAQELAQGRTQNEAKEHIHALFRHRIDATVKADRLGTTMRLAFPEYPWKLFFTEGKAHFRQFFDTIHEAVAAGAYRSRLETIRESRKDFLHHLEQRLAELRASAPT